MNDPHPSTPDSLLDAAEELFAAHGYDAVGIREIADRARANIAAIKYHFGSKSELYLATVRRAMSKGDSVSVWEVLRDPPPTPDHAAIALSRFIRLFLDRLLGSTEGGRCCGLMLREAAEPSEAIDAVIRDFIGPHHRMLMNVIGVIAPALNDDARSACATSVLGQILHHRIFRPFTERMPECAGYANDIDFIAGHITRFSLRGLGCDDAMIDRVVAESARAVMTAAP